MTGLAPVCARSVAEIATPEASRYLQQLCKHFGHKRPVTFDEWSGRIEFSVGECRLDADERVLRLSLATPDAGQMAALQDVVARHLIRFAFRDPPAIEWHAADVGTDGRAG
jgi:uncharacterized protein